MTLILTIATIAITQIGLFLDLCLFIGRIFLIPADPLLNLFYCSFARKLKKDSDLIFFFLAADLVLEGDSTVQSQCL